MSEATHIGVPSEPSSKPNDEATTQVDAATVGDAASSRDSLGFAPYVEALARFLRAQRTRAPLTVSLEGPWGSGKSSFMLQLEAALGRKADAVNAGHRVVRFNAWRYEKDEAMWAAFALAFVRQMNSELALHRRVFANLRVMWSRLDWEQGMFRIARTALLLVAFVALALYGAVSYAAHGLDPARWFGQFGIDPAWYRTTAFGYGGSLLALCIASVSSAWKSIGSPFEHDLNKYFDAPEYRGKRAFIESFQEDFARIVKAYVGTGERVFVFIDDIDRCDVPRAADVLGALHLLTSAENLPLVYVIGLDRGVVAAGIAAKLEKQLVYLAPNADKPAEKAAAGMAIAYEYLEKFIHVPFRIPRPTGESVRAYIRGLGESDTSNVAPVENRAEALQGSIWIETGVDSADILELVALVAPLFDENPRRIKQFLNVFRLQAYIAQKTDLFRHREPAAATLTLPKLAKVTALLLRYPDLCEIVRSRPSIVAELQRLALAVPGPANANGALTSASWASVDDPVLQRFAPKKSLMELLALKATDDEYRLDYIDLTMLLITVPYVERVRDKRGANGSHYAGGAARSNANGSESHSTTMAGPSAARGASTSKKKARLR